MNKYATQAEQHWQAHRPNEYAQMPDRDRFFDMLGEQISYQVAELAREMEGQAPPGESYLAKVGRLATAKSTAEAQVLRETLPAGEGAAQLEEEPQK
jgi:hypothetical protein